MRQVCESENIAAVGELELAAYEARFGPEAASRLVKEDQHSLDLRGFSNKHGSRDALFMLDALLSITSTGGAMDSRVLYDLQSAADALGIDDRYFGHLLWEYDPAHDSGEHRFALDQESLSIGRKPSNAVVLVDPQVAPVHARLVKTGDGWRVVDAGSGRPTLLDGEPIQSAPFVPGQMLSIGPFSLWLSEDQRFLKGKTAESFSTLTIRHLKRTIQTRTAEIRLLSDVSFTVYSGEVIALVGPSGSGKTTLINAINGTAPADSGEVLLNGTDFHALLEYERSMVGIVPQDDLIHPQLRVEESLYLAAKLRFPRDVKGPELQRAVDRVLQKLDIQEIRHSIVGDVNRRGISGGQRKRVNLGQELLTSATEILFLDEPTSGLDPRAAQEIVRLVRSLADDCRIVFLVTHDLSPAIMAQVDHLLVILPGGHLAFFGPPRAACSFFDVSTPDELFNRLDERSAPAWAAAYRDDHAYRKYVETREYLSRAALVEREQSGPLGHRVRVFMGEPAQAPAKGFGTTGEGESSSETRTRPRGRSFLRDLHTQTTRYLKVRFRDRWGTLVLVAQPLLLAMVMMLAFPKPTVPALFMLTLASSWFGMSSSVRELISDRAIWRRERRVGALMLPYLGSKILVLGSIVVFQCFVLSWMLFLHLELGAEGFDLLRLGGVQALTGLTGMSLGLLVSASFASSEAAIGMLPLILVPQITFSSIMVPISEIPGLGALFTWANPLRFAFDAALKTGESLQQLRSYGVTLGGRLPMKGHLYNLGLREATDIDDTGLAPMTLALVLLGFIVAFLLLAAIITRLRDRQVG